MHHTQPQRVQNRVYAKEIHLEARNDNVRYEQAQVLINLRRIVRNDVKLHMCMSTTRSSRHWSIGDT